MFSEQVEKLICRLSRIQNHCIKQYMDNCYNQDPGSRWEAFTLWSSTMKEGEESDNIKVLISPTQNGDRLVAVPTIQLGSEKTSSVAAAALWKHFFDLKHYRTSNIGDDSQFPLLVRLEFLELLIPCLATKTLHVSGSFNGIKKMLVLRDTIENCLVGHLRELKEDRGNLGLITHWNSCVRKLRHWDEALKNQMRTPNQDTAKLWRDAVHVVGYGATSLYPLTNRDLGRER